MEWTFVIRLLLAGMLGAVIGLDREFRAKEAGFRTHFLVCLGSALFVIISIYAFTDYAK
ncbi:MAG: MgtC/SapB family protein, partial [Bacteroidales bacterium]|nr:MgtC/SapB family protein [Bacteroidales bacterium]